MEPDNNNEKISAKNHSRITIILLIISQVFMILVFLFDNGIIFRLKNIANHEEKILAEAETYFFMGDYETIINLYKDPSLQENPIALNNLGYIYSKRLDNKIEKFDETFNLASNYNMRSFRLGCKTALSNWVIMNLKHPQSYKKLLETIQRGYDNNDAVTLEYLSYILGDITTFEKITDDDKINIIKTNQREIMSFDKGVPLKVTEFAEYDYIIEEETIVAYDVKWEGIPICFLIIIFWTTCPKLPLLKCNLKIHTI